MRSLLNGFLRFVQELITALFAYAAVAAGILAFFGFLILYVTAFVLLFWLVIYLVHQLWVHLF